MRMRIAAVGVVFVVALLTFIGSRDSATPIGSILVLGSFAIFAWAVVWWHLSTHGPAASQR